METKRNYMTFPGISRKSNTSINLILNRVCEQLNIDRRDAMSNSRLPHIMEATQIYSKLANEFNKDYPLRVIGELINKGQPSTDYSINKANDLIKYDNSFREKYNLCKEAVKPQTDINLVLSVVCEKLNIDKKEVRSKSRKLHLVAARQIYAKLANEFNKDFTLERLGELISRDHSTVHYSIVKAADLIKYDKSFEEKYNLCRQSIKPYVEVIYSGDTIRESKQKETM